MTAPLQSSALALAIALFAAGCKPAPSLDPVASVSTSAPLPEQIAYGSQQAHCAARRRKLRRRRARFAGSRRVGGSVPRYRGDGRALRGGGEGDSSSSITREGSSLASLRITSPRRGRLPSRAPRRRSISPHSGRLRFDGNLQSAHAIRLYVHAPLDTPLASIMSAQPERFRARVIASGDQGVRVEGPLQSAWPTAGPASH